jgi:hypothetical protein
VGDGSKGNGDGDEVGVTIGDTIEEAVAGGVGDRSTGDGDKVGVVIGETIRGISVAIGIACIFSLTTWCEIVNCLVGSVYNQ